MKSYSVKEIFLTLQGEGAQSGRASVFLRFAGCNLWSGREEDRSSAVCKFCDTDFVGTNGTLGGKYKNADLLADQVNALWPDESQKHKYIVCTGGEPLLQLDEYLIKALHQKGFEVAIETNGTIVVPEGVDWICMSPKPNTDIVVKSGHELKFVYPQPDLSPENFEQLNFQHFFIQPMDGPDIKVNIEKSIAFIHQNPQWRLSLQSHKMIGIR
ncbi:MAG: 7-carboxy-7-deazaguanine synthase [Saprospiraceae bacterium]|nr:7-carboxy-7-deazaguanine synthase [Saprospiraceae bacterium]